MINQKSESFFLNSRSLKSSQVFLCLHLCGFGAPAFRARARTKIPTNERMYDVCLRVCAFFVSGYGLCGTGSTYSMCYDLGCGSVIETQHNTTQHNITRL
jgi:hypothetical protein